MIELLVVIVILGLLFGLLTSALMFARRNSRRAEAKSDCTTILAAMRCYRHEYSRWPCNDNLGIDVQVFSNNNYVILDYMTNIVGGKNPKEIQFLNIDGYHRDAAGNLIDPWKEPYVITISLTNDSCAITWVDPISLETNVWRK